MCATVIALKYAWFNCIVVALYRPGSATLQQRFFAELATPMEPINQVPVYIAGDFNIRLDRPDDAFSCVS